MNREIKFRAWDKERKRMVLVPSLSFGDDGSALTTIVNLKDKDGGYEYDRGLVVGETCELMQFTGLKDKNGVEIYGGDILAVYDFIKGDTGERVEVRWGAWGWTLWNPAMPDILSRYVNPDFLKIVGNIWESPELIDSEKSKGE